MAKLYHHPFCPHSRFVRLVLAEYGLGADLIEVRVWERNEAFLTLNPEGTTPVFQETHGIVVPGADVISEYFDETRGLALGERRLLPENPAQRIEVRRLMNWFNRKFFDEVTAPLVTEKVYKRQPGWNGPAAPETGAIRAARANVRYHLAYVGYLIEGRNWLAGARITHADLAAAAHLSCVDYLGEVPWDEDETAKGWYARVKSRPAFRPLLRETVAGMPPAASYADLDF